MSSPLVFVRDGRTLPYIPVTVAALEAIRTATPKRRPYAITTYMALLEFANEDRTDRVALSQRILVERVGASRTTVQAALADLQGAGVLRVVERVHGNARVENEYVVIEPAERSATSFTPARDTGDPRPPHGQRTQEVRQEEQPSLSENTERLEPSTTSHGLLEAQLVAREESSVEIGEVVEMAPPLRFNGKPVPAGLATDALAALAYFNERTGQALKPTTASGRLTDGMSRIIGAMAEYPEVRIVWKRMIDHNLMAPWWQGEPTPNVIFGKGAVQQSIQKAHRRPVPGGNMKLKPAGQALRALRLAAEAG